LTAWKAWCAIKREGWLRLKLLRKYGMCSNDVIFFLVDVILRVHLLPLLQQALVSEKSQWAWVWLWIIRYAVHFALGNGKMVGRSSGRRVPLGAGSKVGRTGRQRWQSAAVGHRLE
jgi:hypothetical protein